MSYPTARESLVEKVLHKLKDDLRYMSGNSGSVLRLMSLLQTPTLYKYLEEERNAMSDTLSLAEMRDLLASWEERSTAQAPYFDDRLLSKIRQMTQCIAEVEAEELTSAELERGSLNNLI